MVFDPAGGSASFPTRRTVTKGQRCPRPTPDPTRAGYLFDGWFTGNTPLAHDFNQPITDDTTLTAHWSPTSIDNWSMTPDHGTTRGGDTVTLTPPPPRGIRFTQVSAGINHSLGIGSDGNLYGWGRNDYGVLGRPTNIGTMDYSPTPTAVPKPAGAPAGFTWTQAIAGNWHSMAFGSDGNLYTWGNNYNGQLGRATNSGTWNPNPTPTAVPKPAGAPAGFTWTKAIAGQYYSMAFGSDGNLYTWGNNRCGQLGRTTPDIGSSFGSPNPTPGPVDKPTGAPAGFTWTQASAGYLHSMAFGSDGNLYTWGNNGGGQLGRTTNNGTRDYSPTPGPVDKPTGAPAGFTWTQASAGKTHSMAVGSDGNLYTWGTNQCGQLGRTTPDIGSSFGSPNPTPGPVDKPTGAPAGFTWTQASAGEVHSMAVGSDGNLYSWGSNGYGRLGRTTSSTYSNPAPGPVDKPTGTPAGFTWTQATAGETYSMAFGSDGNLYTWGHNGIGQLGRTTNSSYPNPTPGMADFPYRGVPTGVVFGGKAGTALTGNTDGTWKVTTPAHAEGLVDTVITWNRNGVPQADAHLPYTYEAPSYTVDFDPDGGAPKPPDQQVTENHRARRPADPAKAGHVFDGWFIGNTPTAYDFSKPVTGPVSLKAHWSPNQSWTISPDHGSELGGEQVTLTPPAPRGIRFTQVSAGQHHSLAIGSDGNLYSWGWNLSGQLGRTTADIGNYNSANPTPGMVDKPAGAPAGFTWTRAIAGYQHSMAFGSDGNLYTWGLNSDGELGRPANNGTMNPNPTPGPVDKPTGAPAGFTWTQATAGWTYSMALGSDGNLYTWGNSGYGELGRPSNTGTNPTPGLVDKPAGAPAGFTWTQATAGYQHSLALGSDGNLYTWGLNGNGQLGRPANNGTDNPNPTPGPVDKPTGAPAGFTWTQATTGGYNSMAFGSDGNIYTWGSNQFGQLGRTTNNASPNPTPGLVDKPTGAPAGFTWTQATAGYWHSLTVGSDGNLYTWGLNSNGQLGRTTNNGTTDPNPTPGMVDFPGPAVPTGVRFGTKPGTGLTANADGTWRVTTPAHDPGTVTVTIDWTRDGAVQPPDTGNRYEFRPIAVLPLAGGEGILPLLLIGLLAMGAALAGRRHRQDTTTPTSPE